MREIDDSHGEGGGLVEVEMAAGQRLLPVRCSQPCTTRMISRRKAGKSEG